MLYSETKPEIWKIIYSDRVPTINSEEITIVTEVLEEFLIYLEDEDDPEVLKYNMRILGGKLDAFAQDAKLNAWDTKVISLI